MPGTDVRAELLTPRARGGIAVVALVGEGRFAAAARLLGRSARVDPRPALRWLWLEGERLDQAVVFDRPAVSTIELHVHGSEAVLRAIERVLGRLLPAVRASRQALLASAAGSAQLDFALEQTRLLAPYGGSFAAYVVALAEDTASLRAVRARYVAARAMTTPCAIALCGRKNAGKSTLMNRLLFAARVLTGPAPGLTRDVVREPVTLDGYPYELIDTAGEGAAVDSIDARALELSRAARAQAIAVLVVDASVGIGEVEREILRSSAPVVIVQTKMDLPRVAWPRDVPPPAVEVARADGESPQALLVRERLGMALRTARGLPPAGRLGGIAPMDGEELDLLRVVGRD